jgi:hypothetical protein
VRLSRSATFLTDLVLRHWASKIGALLLAAVLFVFTRDEVTRAFEIPVRVVHDSERVLLTELPSTVQVQVRGPWTRLNRLQGYDIGAATLDLRDAQPGPLEIDRASIVMPAGVVLAGVHYDHVDLRFEPIVQEAVEITPIIVGTPALDHRLTRVETEPSTWEIRGGRSQVAAVAGLETEPVEIDGASETLEVRVALVRPSGVRFVQGGPVQVRVRAIVEPELEDHELVVRTPSEGPLAAVGVLDPSYAVRVHGPAPSFRELEKLALDEPVVAAVQGVQTDEGEVVELRFEWHEGVPSRVRDRLRLERSVVRVALPSEDSASARADD